MKLGLFMKCILGGGIELRLYCKILGRFDIFLCYDVMKQSCRGPTNSRGFKWQSKVQAFAENITRAIMVFQLQGEYLQFVSQANVFSRQFTTKLEPANFTPALIYD